MTSGMKRTSLDILADQASECSMMLKRTKPGTGEQSQHVNTTDVDGKQSEQCKDVLPPCSDLSPVGQSLAHHGVCVYKNGARYEGQLHHKKPHGFGLLWSKDGRLVYQGMFSNGFKHGEGKHFFQCGSQIDCEFVNNVPHGKVVITYVDKNQYHGGMFFWKLHGPGEITYSNGVKYKGEFFDGKRHGQGAMTMSDGRRYEGAWFCDKRHGKGKFYFVNGAILEGEWYNDKYCDTVSGVGGADVREQLSTVASQLQTQLRDIQKITEGL